MIRISGLFILIGLMSCGPKPADIKQQDTATPVIKDTVKQSSNPDCPAFADLSGYDRERAETAYILYRDYLKAGKYDDALVHWKIAYGLAPGSNGRVKYQFSDGAAIYKNLYDQEANENLKKKYVDTIMMIYDKQISCFGDTALVNGLKAFDLYYYYPEYADENTVFGLFKSNFDKKGINADYFVVNPFTKMLFDRVVEERIDMIEGRKYADLIFKTVEKGLKECKGSGCETWNIINDYAPVRLENLEGVDGFYDCAYYAEKYYALYKNNPDSCDVINLAYSRMLRGECPATLPQFVEVKAAKDAKCYVAPPAVSCLRQAYDAYFEGKYKTAVAHFDRCINEFQDRETKAKYQLIVSKIYYGDLKDFPKARKYALDAASNKSNWGEPYMLIGKLYASSGPLCGPGTGWDSQVVTWPAIDKFEFAKRIDPSVAPEANKLIAQYSKYMPKKEDLHFRMKTAGESFRVGCWIQENTIIRTAD
jgi:tetratricopeptide (TPR) repeat protein